MHKGRDEQYALQSQRNALILNFFFTETATVGLNLCNPYRASNQPNSTLSLLPNSTTTPTSRTPSTQPTYNDDTLRMPKRRLSTGAYAGIGVGAGFLCLALVVGMIFQQRRQQRPIELENTSRDARYELDSTYKDPLELEEQHGISEAPYDSAPQELDGKELGTEERLK